MLTILLGGAIALVISLFGTPLMIKFMVRKGYGQFIRDDGPTEHHTKRGTPTMGGVVVVGAAVLAYALSHLLRWRPPTASGLLVLWLVVGLCAIGFVDDFRKISKERSLGLRSWEKLVGQGIVATVFGVLALNWPDESGLTPASSQISWVRDIEWLDMFVWGPVIGTILFVLWSNFIVAATGNAVNLTDGLDGLATGASVMVFGAYVIIGIWQSNQNCQWVQSPGGKCYEVRDATDLAVLAACITGACLGFLWWNASPAKIFMGDTGSLALGGGLAGLAMVSRTELLLVVLGGLYVTITASVILQVASFKLRRKRIFRMTPLHHHFELIGWSEVTIVVRFWVISALFVATGLGIFYGEWVVGL